jgi:hypothetical protein
VLLTLALRIRTGLSRLAVKTKRLLHAAIRPLPVVVGLMRDLTRSRDQLIAENALLRQQLIVACSVLPTLAASWLTSDAEQERYAP